MTRSVASQVAGACRELVPVLLPAMASGMAVFVVAAVSLDHFFGRSTISTILSVHAMLLTVGLVATHRIQTLTGARGGDGA